MTRFVSTSLACGLGKIQPHRKLLELNKTIYSNKNLSKLTNHHLYTNYALN